MITAGNGKYAVWLKQEKMGDHLLYILGGGERSHIGGMVLCEVGKKPQIVRLEGHYDDIVLKPIALAACAKYHTTVVAVGGIHVDDASQKEIDQLVKNCKELVACI